MFAIAGQMGRPNSLTFFEGTKGYPARGPWVTQGNFFKFYW